MVTSVQCTITRQCSNIPQYGGAGREDELVSSEALDGAIQGVGGESDVEEVVLRCGKKFVDQISSCEKFC